MSRVVRDSNFAVPGVYHVARFLLSIIFLSLVSLFVQRVLKSVFFQVIAFLLIVSASNYPVVVPVNDTWRFGGAMAWWTIMDPLLRIAFLPHLLAGQSLILFLILAGSDRATLERRGNWIFLGIFGFILGMVFTPGLVFVGTVYGVLSLIECIDILGSRPTKQEFFSWLGTNLLSRIIILALSVPALFYYFHEFTVYPWKRLVELDILHPLPFTFPEYFYALGITLPLGALGLIMVFLRKARGFFPVISWVLAWALLLFVFRYIPQQSPLRFSEMTPHVPLGILTMYLFSVALIRGSGRRGNFFLGFLRHGFHFVLYMVLFIIIGLGLGNMYSSYLWQRDFYIMKIRAGWPAIPMNNYIVYPLRSFADAIGGIASVTGKDAVILSEVTAGNYIPAVAGRRVYIGHDNTVNRETKDIYVKKFYRLQMTRQEARNWMTEAGITHVFWSVQEEEEGKGKKLTTVYPFLTEVLNINNSILYAVK